MPDPEGSRVPRRSVHPLILHTLAGLGVLAAVHGGSTLNGEPPAEPSYKAPRIEKRELANPNWGYPKAKDPRRIPPTILMVVHIFGVQSTAAMPVGIGPGSGTQREYQSVARPAWTRNSAHDYIARNGEVIEVLDPATQTAWNNGKLDRPDRKIATIDAIAAQSDYNANEYCYREVECTGFPGSHPLTDEQLETVAWFTAQDSLLTKLDINRATVTTHADFDSVNRPSCAFPPAEREGKLGKIIDRAKAIKAEMLKKEK